MSLKLCLFYNLHSCMNFYFIAYHYLSCLGNCIPGKPEFFPTDLTTYGKTCFCLSPWVHHYAAKLNITCNGFGHPAKGQLAVQLSLVAFHFIFIAHKAKLCMLF